MCIFYFIPLGMTILTYCAIIAVSSKQITTTILETAERNTVVDSANANIVEDNLSKSYCSAAYPMVANRKYSTEPLKPTLLYSFPGSGNTWTRLLIEYTTGVVSGSVYTDRDLAYQLPGERLCNIYQSVIKAHPQTHEASKLLVTGFDSDKRKCSEGQILKFKRAVILVRNPFDAIWTELQRRLSNSHVGILTTDLFDVPESNCSTTTNNRPRKRMWDKIHAYLGMLSHYYEHMGIQNQYIIDTLPSFNIHTVSYEALKNKDTRVDTLQKLKAFLNIALETKKGDDMDNREIIECAFILADNRKVNRNHKDNNIAPMSSPTRRVMGNTNDSANSTSNKVIAKKNVFSIEIICGMWNVFKKTAIQYNYTKPAVLINNDMTNDYNCDGYKPLLNFKGR